MSRNTGLILGMINVTVETEHRATSEGCLKRPRSILNDECHRSSQSSWYYLSFYGSHVAHLKLDIDFENLLDKNKI